MPAHEALVALLNALSAEGYDFTAPTPATHRFVSGRRREARPGCLRDVFGWSLPFGPDDLPGPIMDSLLQAGALLPAGSLQRSALRVATLDGRLHLHSAPSDDPDAVFLGPDSYRFVRFLASVLQDERRINRALDLGVGAGAGGLALAACRPEAEVYGVDVNPQALRLLAANADHAGLTITPVQGSGPNAVEGRFDLIIANPPYVAGSGGRVYRDGGDQRGMALGLAWVRDSLPRLAPGGRMIFYTGSPIEDGVDPVKAELHRLAAEGGFACRYEEIDPDIFGGMLKQSVYAGVDRIAAVGAVLSRGG